jgi:hypothetical protein
VREATGDEVKDLRRIVQTAGLLFQRGSIRDAQSKWRVGAGRSRRRNEKAPLNSGFTGLPASSCFAIDQELPPKSSDDDSNKKVAPFGAWASPLSSQAMLADQANVGLVDRSRWHMDTGFVRPRV